MQVIMTQWINDMQVITTQWINDMQAPPHGLTGSYCLICVVLMYVDAVLHGGRSSLRLIAKIVNVWCTQKMETGTIRGVSLEFN